MQRMMFTLRARGLGASKTVNPLAWLLAEQQAHVGICQKYAALCKNIEEVKNGLSFPDCFSAITQQLRGQRVPASYGSQSVLSIGR